MDRKEYIERWSDFKTEYSKLITGLVLKSTLLLDSLPFGKTENNKYDLRGINLKEIDDFIENQKPNLTEIVFQNCDFSYSNFDNLKIEKCQFINCTFVSVYCRDLMEIDNLFKQCYFQKVDFRRAEIGIQNSKFDECIFEKCNFIGCFFSSPQFTNISFVNNNFREIDFAGSSFENCLFEGTMSHIAFRGDVPKYRNDNPGYKVNQMNQVSFEKLDFNVLVFSEDCKLDQVKINSNPKYLMVHDFKSKTKELYHVRNQYTEDTIDFIENLYFVAKDRNQNAYLFNTEDWFDEDSNVEEINAIFDFFRK